MYLRMLRVDEVCQHSYIFSYSSIQPGHEGFVITGMVNIVMVHSRLLIFCMLVEKEPNHDYNGGSKANIRLLGRRRSCLTSLLNLGCFN